MKKKFLKNGSGGHLVFQNEAKVPLLKFINLLCKFGKFMFTNEGGRKSFVKHDKRTHRRMDGRTLSIS